MKKEKTIYMYTLVADIKTKKLFCIKKLNKFKFN